MTSRRGKISLLDCTLRDGGYVNDWRFGHDNIVSIFERVVDAGIDIIEVGFLDERRGFDNDRSIMPNTDAVNEIFAGIDKKNAMVVGMIDYGTCRLQNIKPKDQCFLDGIRVIFKKHLRKAALGFCGELINLGYKVFAQLVSVTDYSDDEIVDLISLANGIKPYAVSIVDTYGLLHQDNLMHYFELLNAGLDKSISLGYHAHNNFQMGYANCIELLKSSGERDILVDGSLYGMGKSAGNAPLELIAMHLNERYDKKYAIGQLLEAIDTNISLFYRPSTWGYNMFYYLAASNDCHPNYVAYLMDKKTLSVNSINEILGGLDKTKKLAYDKEYIEERYIGYQNNIINDKTALKRLAKLINNRNVLIVGSGVSVKSHLQRIQEYIGINSPIVVAINFIPDEINVDGIFISNYKRYLGLASKLVKHKYTIIATSNVTPYGRDGFEFVFNYASLIDCNAEIIDNSFIMLLKLLILLGKRKVTVAGCDGYSSHSDNYYNMRMEYDFIKNKAEYLNKYTRDFIAEHASNIRVEFLTESLYENK